MATFKRVLATLAIIIAVLVAFVSIGGVAGTWVVNGVFTRGAERILSGAERALDVTSEGLNNVDARLEGARVSVKTVEDTALQIGDSAVETKFALTLIEKTVGEDLFPRVDTARETLGAIRASVINLNNTLEAANEMPFVSVPTLTDELEAVAERATETRSSVDELRNVINDAKAGVVESIVDPITRGTAKIDSGLSAVQEKVTEFDGKVTNTRAEVTALKSKIATGLDVVAIVFTLWFAWVAISQIAVVAVSVSHLRGDKGKEDVEPTLAYLETPEPVELEDLADANVTGTVEESESPSTPDEA